VVTLAVSTGIGFGRNAETTMATSATPMRMGTTRRKAAERLRDSVRVEGDDLAVVGFINLWLSGPRADRGDVGAG
jgi:hypothetical protein